MAPTTSSTNSNWFEKVPVTCSSKHFVWTVRGTNPCDQIKINQSQIGMTNSHNSLRTLFQDGGSRGTRCLERLFHQTAFRLLQFLSWPHLIGNKALFYAQFQTELETIQAMNNFAEQSAVCSKLIYFNATLLF